MAASVAFTHTSMVYRRIRKSPPSPPNAPAQPAPPSSVAHGAVQGGQGSGGSNAPAFSQPQGVTPAANAPGGMSTPVSHNSQPPALMSAPPTPPPMAFPSSMPPSPVLAMPGGMTALASQSPAASQSSQAISILTRLGANNVVATALGDNASGTVATAPVGVPGSTIVTTNAQGQATTETQAPPASITATFLTSTDIGGVPTQVLTTAVVPNPSARGSLTGGSNQSATIGAAVGSTLFVLILLTVCIVLRRKKQRRIRAADPRASAAPSLTPTRDRFLPFVIEPYEAHRDDPENHPNRAKMAAIDLSPVTNITSDSTAHTKHEVVPDVPRDPFGDDARVVFEQSDPFADPGLATQGTPRRLETQTVAPSRLSITSQSTSSSNLRSSDPPPPYSEPRHSEAEQSSPTEEREGTR
ncbi:hypothetical protein JB92DRAFT_556306 [Gautieria morchelliformis]|nr:hypothetical protein JB92DRAFT_556306 [Gautieria morchelliformis]